MNMIFKILFSALVLMFFLCCEGESTQPKPISESINKILPLGASRVEGFRPHFESYRYELWKELIRNKWTFDFIGTRTDLASYPIFENSNFDIDHEGRGGITSGEILEGINEWLDATGAPDIVLFSSPRGNDILDGHADPITITNNINQIIDILQAKNPAVTVVIEELAPGRSSLMTSKIAEEFNAIREAMKVLSTEQSTATSRVITVDMYSGFTDGMLADDVHYNLFGADFIASQYYKVLVDVMEK